MMRTSVRAKPTLMHYDPAPAEPYPDHDPVSFPGGDGEYVIGAIHNGH